MKEFEVFLSESESIFVNAEWADITDSILTFHILKIEESQRQINDFELSTFRDVVVAAFYMSNIIGYSLSENRK